MISFFDSKLQYFITRIMRVPFKIVACLFGEERKKNLTKRYKRFLQKTNPNFFDTDSFLSYVQRKKEGFEQNCSRIETLALRGSNADYGFYSPSWKNSYNIGLTSSDLHNSYFLYKNYRIKLRRLRNIIVFGSVGFIGYNLIRTSERYRAVAYKYFFNIPYFEEGIINPVFEKKILKKCSELKPAVIDSYYKGYEINQDFMCDVKAEARVTPHLRENQREPDQLYWLVKLRDLIIEDNRKIFILIPPFRSDYRSLLPNQYDLFNKLLKIEGIEFLNYYDTEIFDDSDFGDPDHLNEKGAIKLTNDIMSRFKSIELL